MTRSLVSLVLALTCLAALPAAASAGAGFVVPSRNTTCGLLTAEQTGSRAGLFCSSSYIEQGQYGKTWRRNGDRCVSRSTGLTCRRGAHGFFLSRDSQRYF